jgi:Xaa-Pro dipeptidase
MLASLRHAGEHTREGMTPADIDAMIASVHKKMGSDYDGGLVLIGESSAYPHGSHKPQIVKRGEVVLMDCTSAVHGYQADITRTFVFAPTRPRAAQTVGPGSPRPADRDPAASGCPPARR